MPQPLFDMAWTPIIIHGNNKIGSDWNYDDGDSPCVWS
jgi:hypothetical protein